MRYFIIIISFCFFQNIYSQFDSEWVLGTRGGVVLNFEGANPVVKNFNEDFSLRTANASICDDDGNLLFYSNGCKIFNKNFEVMSNGDSLGYPTNPFCNNGFGSPLSQSAMIIPHHNSIEKYILVHSEFSADSLDLSNLFVSIIDMDSNNGLGEVILKREVILTDAISRSGFEMTRHRNGEDWWIIVPKIQSNCYNVLLLAEEGITNTDVYCLGTYWSLNDVQGQMDVSPNGEKFGRFIYEHGLNIYDFNNSTGELSSPYRIDFGFTDTIFHTGIIFSPNSKFVYASTFNDVFQFDITDVDILASRVNIASLSTPDTILFPTRFNQGAIAANGKIYIGGTIQYNHLHVIHNPDCKGINSNLEQYAIEINKVPHFSANGVPHIPHFRSQPQNIDCDTVNVITNTNQIAKQNIEHYIYPNPFLDILDITVGELTTGFTFKMYDLLGKELLAIDAVSSSIQIDLGYVLDGMYFYQILNESEPVANGKLQKISY